MEKFYSKFPALAYDDVQIVPVQSSINSRLDTDVSFSSRKLKLNVPFFSAPMDTVTESAMVAAMGTAGGIGIVHRYMSLEARFRQAYEGNAVAGVAVGLEDPLEEILKWSDFYEMDNLLICLDVAHGDHVRVHRKTEELAAGFGNRPGFILMVGNVATRTGTHSLIRAGADLIRIGVGSGSICSTRLVTGTGVPSITAIMEARSAVDGISRDVKLIADGGIRTSGDIAKAIAAGAHGVMLGSLLAGTDEAPGNIVMGNNGKMVKAYRGMASKDSQTGWRMMKPGTAAEGVSVFIPYKGSVLNVLMELKGGLHSALSYGDARNLEQYYDHTQFVIVTGAGIQEASTHIDRIK